MKTTFGFIGCGNMGGALASAVAKTASAENILLCDAFAEKAEALAARGIGRAVALSELASDCDYIFLGVKPQGFAALFEELRPLLAARKSAPVLVSMAAGLSISAVCELAGGKASVIRIMPNTPVSVGEGMILYTANARVSEAELEIFCKALSAAGKLDPIAEDKIDAASALSGCGPAFVYLFAEAMADAGVECGLQRNKAIEYAAQTLLGASKLLLNTKKHPAVLKDEVCSPSGSTIEGVHALEDNGFRGTVMSAVKASFDKTNKL